MKIFYISYDNILRSIRGLRRVRYMQAIRLLKQRRANKMHRLKKGRAKNGSTQYKRYKEQARVLIHERILFWNRVYGFTYGRVFIKNQKTRWGSCSKQGNLNFSYKLVFLSPHLVDYIIVHELCHLKEFNHGPNFWALVARMIPDYKKCRAELRVHVV